MGKPALSSRWNRAKDKKNDKDPRRCPNCFNMGKKVYIINEKKFVSIDNILHCKTCQMIFMKEVKK